MGWRAAFALGAILAGGILVVRRNVPESPRWLFIHGREEEGEAIVRSIEETVHRETGRELPAVEDKITIRQRKSIGMGLIARTVFTMYPKRTVLCFSLFVGQAFLYNAFFFTYGDTLGTFLDVEQTGWYLAIFAASNFMGALLLSPLFDIVGRVKMITGTEIFPMETGAMCIAFFYAIGTAVGGISGRLLFGKLIEDASASKDITQIAVGYFIGAALMVGRGLVEAFLGVKAEGQPLENIAQPLTAVEPAEHGTSATQPA